MNKIMAHVGLATGLTIGIGGSMALDVPERISPAIEYIGDIGVSLSPKVEASTTEMLVEANDALNNIATPYLLGVFVLELALLGHVLVNDRARSMRDLGLSSAGSDKLRLLLPLVTMACIGTGSGLAQDISAAANRPLQVGIEAMTQSGIDVSDFQKFTQHTEQVLNNHGGIPVNVVDRLIEKHGSDNIVPLRIALGSVFVPKTGEKPPSAAIVTLPTKVMETLGHKDIANSANEVPRVMVGNQLSVNVGEKIIVDGHEFEVEGFVNEPAGIGRIGVYGSNEDLEDIFPENTYSLVMVRTDLAQHVASDLKQQGVEYGQQSLDDLYKKYKDFFMGTVSAAQMDLLLKAAMISAVGGIYIGRNRGRENLARDASLIARGVGRKTLRQAARRATFEDSIKASFLAGPVGIGLMMLTASTQYGFDMQATAKDLGVGLLAGQMTMFVGYVLGERRQINKNDIAANLKVQV